MEPRPLSGLELQVVTALWVRTRRCVEAVFRGDSMAPAIADGSLLRLHCGRRPRRGDVAALVWDGHLLVHRVVALGRTGLRTRGDALLVPDPPVPRSLPYARVAALR
jgi:hypothetical protein